MTDNQIKWLDNLISKQVKIFQ